uniref:C-type lectin domain-containing protein n=1 Tax=Acrobeloides nanus TaxID=290746 RepID=A0A914EKA8_9BILA
MGSLRHDYSFMISSYTNWGPGYPNGIDRCAALGSNDGITSVWENFGCNPKESGLVSVLCQGKSCDASSVACCAFCTSNGVSYEKKQKIRTKHRHIKRMKLVNGKPVRIA